MIFYQYQNLATYQNVAATKLNPPTSHFIDNKLMD
jgi:hypothetical protein